MMGSNLTIKILIVSLFIFLFTNPVLAGAWTLGEKKVLLKFGSAYWQTNRKFASANDLGLTFDDIGKFSEGDVIPFDPFVGGELKAATFSTDIRYGINDYLDFGLSLPLLWNDFNTFPSDTIKSQLGIGDLRLESQAMVFKNNLFAIAGKLNLKIPTGIFQKSIYTVTLTEGQFDAEFISSFGASLYPYGYTNFEIGYRYRAVNTRNNTKPGDQLVFNLEGGLNLPFDLILKGAIDGLASNEGFILLGKNKQPLPKRNLISTWVGLIWEIEENTFIEADIRTLILGTDFPNGNQYFFSLTHLFDFK